LPALRLCMGYDSWAAVDKLGPRFPACGTSPSTAA